ASADNSASMNAESRSRIRSGDAWAGCSCRKRAGSILVGAVIVESFFESVVRDHSKGHAVTAPSSTTTRSPNYRDTTLTDSTLEADVTAGVTTRRSSW